MKTSIPKNTNIQKGTLSEDLHLSDLVSENVFYKKFPKYN